MSSDSVAIRVQGLRKCYQIYDSPRDRLKQFVLPRLRRLLRLPPKQYFREFWALDGVSFEVKKGETVGIIGRNGSGKSTLLQIICGTLALTEGQVETTGRIAALLELGSGFNPEFSGRENVYMNAAVLGLTEAEIDERFDAIVEFADIGQFIDQPIKTYSSGMVVRLAFAVIAHVDADILVIDEALSVGDVFFVQKCMRFLRRFMEHGTVLFVSHDTGAVLNFCEKVVWLYEGQMKAVGEPKEITQAYLEQLYAEQQGNGAAETAPVAGAGAAAEANASQEASAVPAEATGSERAGVPAMAAAGGAQRSGHTDPLRDMRLDFLNQTNLRNDIEVFNFREDSQSFGAGGVEIIDAAFLDENGRRLAWVVGGEYVELVIRCIAHQDVYSPIIGFTVRDRLGQEVFVDNTYLSYASNPLEVKAQETFEARFGFFMPRMPTGDYTISVAVAEGTQTDHVQHQWRHDAVAFQVHASSVCLGLIGIPMQKIELAKT